MGRVVAGLVDSALDKYSEGTSDEGLRYDRWRPPPKSSSTLFHFWCVSTSHFGGRVDSLGPGTQRLAVVVGFARTGDGYDHRQGATFARAVI